MGVRIRGRGSQEGLGVQHSGCFLAVGSWARPTPRRTAMFLGPAGKIMRLSLLMKVDASDLKKKLVFPEVVMVSKQTEQSPD